MFTYTYTHLYSIYTYTHSYIYTYTLNISLHMFTYTYILNIHLHMFTYTYTHLYSIYTYTLLYIYLHTEYILTHSDRAHEYSDSIRLAALDAECQVYDSSLTADRREQAPAQSCHHSPQMSCQYQDCIPQKNKTEMTENTNLDSSNECESFLRRN